MSKLVIMQGLPASGKSTRAQEIHKKSGNAVRINKDLLRTMLHFDKWTGKNEELTRTAARLLAREFLMDGKTVIIDDTNLNLGTLESWKELARTVTPEAKVQVVRMDTPIEECLRRDDMREKPVGAHVIRQMAFQHLEYMKGEKVVICDLDGTLCDIAHRLKFVRGVGKKDWKAFFGAITSDTLREDVLRQLREVVFEHDAKVIFVSARPDTYRAFTMDWLADHLLGSGIETRFAALIMRSGHDKRDDTEVKAEIYDKFLKHLNIVAIFDDRPSVIRMWREKGLNVVDVGSGVEF